MSFDLSGRSLTPLSELISEAEFPLSDLLPLDDVAELFASLYVADHSTMLVGDNLLIDCLLAMPGELSFSLPGADSFAFVLGSAGPGWTAIKMHLSVGPDYALVLSGLTLALRFDPAVLREPTTGAGTEIGFSCSLTLDADGLRISDYSGLILPKSAVGGTAVLIEANDVTLVLDGDELPPFIAGQEGFRGVVFASLGVTIPAEYLSLGPGQTLNLTIQDGAVGTTGFTGQTLFSSGSGQPVTGRFLGFDCRIREVEVDLIENSLVAGRLELDLRLEALEEGGNEKWVGLDVSLDQSNGFSAKASTVQPPDTSDTPDALVTLNFAGAVRLELSGLRIERQATNDVWAVYFSGDLQVQIPGATWPEIGFDELGVSSDGELLLPEGGGITFETPLVVEWYFVRLLIPKFRFGRPEGSDTLLQVRLNAEVDLIEGLPAGASVEGLTITWDPGGGSAPDVSFTGIGVEFSTPGVFSAGIEVGFIQQGTSVEFRGQGHLTLNALDMGLEIGVIVGYDQPQDFTYLYLFADAKLLPTGIPIGNTGLSIYGFQGLIAYNMALTLDTALPEDERYYELFVKPPIGITDIGKWGKHKGQNALGIGVVLGTADKGFSFNVKGLIAVAFPDMVLILQAKANFIKLKPDLSTSSEGTMDALMVYDSVQNTFTFDVVAKWGMPSIVEVSGSAQVFFDFDDPGAFYLRIGQDIDGKRVSANVIRWGSKWLFSAGFWFELNTSGVITGVLIEVGARYEKGGFWIEAIGRARGEMKLFWEPPQWEGSLALEGRIGAGYRGISVGISLGGSATVRVVRPTEVRIHAEACFKALFWKVCKGHTFKWERLDPPLLERPIRDISATPRDWTLRVGAAPSPGAGGAGGAASADDGVTALVEAATARAVQPHSFLVINFAKPMIDNTGKFNEAVQLPNQGFLTVGENSGFAASYELLAVTLVRDPAGAAEAIDIWGSWALETPNYNSSLRLLSSERFGHDGSLTESFVEGVDLDYCGVPEDRRICLPLAGLTPGYGWIRGRYAYFWDTSKSGQPFSDRRNVPFIELLAGDRLSVWLDGGESGVTFTERQCPRRDPPDRDKTPEDGDRPVIPPFLWPLRPLWPLLVRIAPRIADLFGRFGRPAGTTGGTTVDLPGTPVPGERGERGEVVVSAGDRGRCLETICFTVGHDAPEYVVGTRRGGTQTANEEWTVPDSARLMIPGDTYELTVDLRTRLRAPNGSVSDQPAAQQAWRTRFTVDRPPLYPGALGSYVAATYPGRGARPVYTGYDFALRFVDTYVNFLYAAAQEALLIRLFDSQGRPVTDGAGNPVLLPATRDGMPETSLSQSYWEEQYLINKDKGCIVQDLGGQSGSTTLAIPASSVALTANSQYVAELVSDADLGIALHSWTFTTSGFATFTDLLTAGRSVLPPKPVPGPAAGSDFGTACRQLGIDTVAFAPAARLTPVVSLDRTRLYAVLLDAPEPMDPGTRLSLTLNGGAVEVLANLDGTRLILRRAAGDWPTGAHELILTWSRGLPGAPAETLRAVAGVLGIEQVTIAFSSGGI